MRFFLALSLIANLALFALGQGYLGYKPVDDGRTSRPFSERMQHSVDLGKPIIQQEHETNS